MSRSDDWLWAPTEGAAPSPGHYMVRLVAGGAEVPAMIAYVTPLSDPETGLLMDRSSYYVVDVAGKRMPTKAARGLIGRRITEPEYLYQLADLEWARQHRPSDPRVNPREPVSLRNVPPPKF